MTPGLEPFGEQSGYTSLVNKIRCPSGERITPPASVGRLVTAFASEPSPFIDQTCDPLLRSEMKKMRFPSGIQRGRVLELPS